MFGACGCASTSSALLFHYCGFTCDLFALLPPLLIVPIPVRPNPLPCKTQQPAPRKGRNAIPELQHANLFLFHNHMLWSHQPLLLHKPQREMIHRQRSDPSNVPRLTLILHPWIYQQKIYQSLQPQMSQCRRSVLLNLKYVCCHLYYTSISLYC